MMEKQDAALLRRGFVVLGILAVIALFAMRARQAATPETIEVFFVDRTLLQEPDLEYAAMVRPLARPLPAGGEALSNALEALLAGPLGAETNRYLSAIPPGTRLRGVVCRQGVVFVDFDRRLHGYGGGSANAASIRAQIERTLLAVPGVRAVEILVDGASEGVLAP